MALDLRTPGVHIREIPSGVRSIAGAPTSIAAFVGGFARGPLDVPLRLFNQGDFDAELGGISADHPASYAVSQFFVNGGGQAWAVRVSPDAGEAVITMQSRDGGSVLRARAGRQVDGAVAADPGAHGNDLRLDVDYLAADPATQFNLTITEIRVADGREVPVRSEVYRNLTIAAGPRNALDVVNAASRLIQLERDAAWDVERPAPTGFHSGLVDLTGLPAAGDYDVDIDLGAGAETVSISLAAQPASLAEAAGALQAAIRGARPADRLWAQTSVTVEDGRLRVLVGRGSPDYAPETVVSFADVNPGTFAADLSLDAASNEANVQQYAAGNGTAGLQASGTAGSDGTAATDAVLRGSRADRTGFYALDNVDAFNLLSIPEASMQGGTAGLAAVMSAAITYCTERRAMVFIDPPEGTDTLEEAETWLGEIADAGLRSPNSMAYYPRVQMPDPAQDNRLRSTAPSGTMAGVFARTDGQVGVWKAPAGITARLMNVPALDHAMTDPENGVLNPLGLNALRNFPVPGNVAWGARTLMGADLLASDWKYIPVRRMALFIESSLYDGLQWAVFQPNDFPLWNEIRGAVNGFMQGLFRQGAFQGASPRDAYLVKCDAETTTPADVNAGIVNVFVGFAPLRPAEFVVVSLQLQMQSV